MNTVQTFCPQLVCVCLHTFPVLCGLKVSVRGAFVHGQRGGLSVGFATVVAGVRFAVGVNHMVLVQAGVLRESLITPWHGAHVRFLSWTHGQVQHIVIIGQKNNSVKVYCDCFKKRT